MPLAAVQSQAHRATPGSRSGVSVMVWLVAVMTDWRQCAASPKEDVHWPRRHSHGADAAVGWCCIGHIAALAPERCRACLPWSPLFGGWPCRVVAMASRSAADSRLWSRRCRWHHRWWLRPRTSGGGEASEPLALLQAAYHPAACGLGCTPRNCVCWRIRCWSRWAPQGLQLDKRGALTRRVVLMAQLSITTTHESP